MLADAEIVAQNPWWATPTGWEAEDPHLRRLARMPRRLPARLVDRFDLSIPAIHTLRGPRQVGKSTAMKLMVSRALEAISPDRVIYLALDLLDGQPAAEIARSVARAKELAGATSATTSLVLLDEVTVTSTWQTAIKSLWDDGKIDRDVVVCTGSSSIDLALGTADRLPGRRGSGQDHLMLPADFGAFARAIDDRLPEPPARSLADIASADGFDLLLTMRKHVPALDHALERYLVFGGLPASVADATTGATVPSDATIRIAEDGLLREIARKGASEPAAWALMERVLRSLGSRVSWQHLARDIDVPLGSRRRSSKSLSPSGPTVRDYIEYLAFGYFLLVVFAWRSDSDASASSKQKKLYFADPLLARAALYHTPGLAFDVPAMIENLVGLALYRRYQPESHRIGGFHDADDLHYWVTRSRGEVDFVAGPRVALDVCEVKYRASLDLREVAKIPAAFPGRPVCVATKRDLEQREGYTMVPASLLLWALSG